MQAGDYLLKQFKDDRGNTGQIADVKPKRQNEQVNAYRIDDPAQDAHQKIEHIFPEAFSFCQV